VRERKLTCEVSITKAMATRRMRAAEREKESLAMVPWSDLFSVRLWGWQGKKASWVGLHGHTSVPIYNNRLQST